MLTTKFYDELNHRDIQARPEDPVLSIGDHVTTDGRLMCVSSKIYDIPNGTVIYRLVPSYVDVEKEEVR